MMYINMYMHTPTATPFVMLHPEELPIEVAMFCNKSHREDNNPAWLAPMSGARCLFWSNVRFKESGRNTLFGAAMCPSWLLSDQLFLATFFKYPIAMFDGSESPLMVNFLNPITFW